MTHLIAKPCNHHSPQASPASPVRTPGILSGQIPNFLPRQAARIKELLSISVSWKRCIANFLLERDFLGVEQVHPQPQVEEPH